MPPSAIADSWSADELADAEALAVLEGWGQEKRRTAELQATLTNELRAHAYITSAGKDAKPPDTLTASHFLPRRVYRKHVERKQQNNMDQMFSRLNAMCGF